MCFKVINLLINKSFNLRNAVPMYRKLIIVHTIIFVGNFNLLRLKQYWSKPTYDVDDYDSFMTCSIHFDPQVKTIRVFIIKT